MDITMVLPLRKGSERIKNKNIKQFGNFKLGIAELKIKQLLKTTTFQEIIVTTDSLPVLEMCVSIKDSRLKCDERPEHLCLNETPAESLIRYVNSLVSAPHTFWVHATSPLITSQDYEMARIAYMFAIQSGYDSLLSAVEVKNFILRENGSIVNSWKYCGETNWPRTQDLEVLYEPTHAMFIAPASLQLKGKRVGNKPYFYITDRERFVDIDEQPDFHRAERLMQSLYGGLAL